MPIGIYGANDQGQIGEALKNIQLDTMNSTTGLRNKALMGVAHRGGSELRADVRSALASSSVLKEPALDQIPPWSPNDQKMWDANGNEFLRYVQEQLGFERKKQMPDKKQIAYYAGLLYLAKNMPNLLDQQKVAQRVELTRQSPARTTRDLSR